MLRLLELENFKAFGARTRIPFAPITLVFGENSAGKSSLLHALSLLKQTRDGRGAGALLLPRAEHGTVDLGSFQELLFDHDLARTLSIRVGADTPRSPVPRRYRPMVPGTLAVELRFRRPTRRSEVMLDSWDLYSADDKLIAAFTPADTSEAGGETWISTPRYRRLAREEFRFLKCVRITDDPEFWKGAFESARLNRQEIQALLTAATESTRSADEPALFDREPLVRRYRDSQKEWLERAQRFFLTQFTLDTYIQFITSQQLNTPIVFEGFIPQRMLPSSARSLTTLAFDVGRHRPNFVEVDVSYLALAAGGLLESTLEALFPLGPFRRPPARWYIFTGSSPTDVGYRGDLLPDLLLRRPELVREANKWLQRLEVGYKLKPKAIGAQQSDLFELRLIDTRRSGPVEVGLADVGFGISQILPFVVQSLASSGQIITIEQPEVHLHPRLQADLGDLIADAIREPRRNQFIIETHSEHLILRLQKLVRSEELRPEDLSIIYVSRGPKGAQATRLQVAANGDFVDEWPGGFFPERLREIQ